MIILLLIDMIELAMNTFEINLKDIRIDNGKHLNIYLFIKAKLNNVLL
jgi:hypothetical protein